MNPNQGTAKFELVFELKPFSERMLFGNGDNKYVPWYGLTDSYYCIDLGECRLLEYTDAFVRRHAGLSRVNDYYLQRIIEDLYSVLPGVCQSIPPHYYSALKQNFPYYLDAAMSDHEDSDLDDRKYTSMNWLDQRRLDTGYLVNGPYIGLYRCGENMLIVWASEEPDGRERWTAPAGQVEISYSQFMTSAECSLKRFIDQMDERTKDALKHDWGDVHIDKDQILAKLAHERGVWESWFGTASKLSECQQSAPTDWQLFEAAHRRVMSHLHQR